MMNTIDQRAGPGPALEPPQPTPVPPRQPAPPAGHWLLRGIGAVMSGRLPYRLQGIVDSTMRALGSPYKEVRVNGARMRVRRGSWDESAALRVIGDQDYLRPGHEILPTHTVIDIGANIGSFAVFAGLAARKGRVFAFEPDAENYALAVDNAALNRLDNVVVERVAVSGTPGTLRLFKGAEVSLHTTLASRPHGADEGEDVPAITLPEIFEKHRIARCDFLKMNCEGAEYEILYRTPPEYLRRIDRIALEYHATEDKERLARELAAFLVAQGIEIFEFTDFVGLDCGYIRGIRRH
jgi:FkbM family methyltransferase